MSDIDPLHHHPFRPSFPGAMICVEHTEMLPSGVCGYPATHEVHRVVSLDAPSAPLELNPARPQPGVWLRGLHTQLDLFESRVQTAAALEATGRDVPIELRMGIDSARERLIELYKELWRS